MNVMEKLKKLSKETPNKVAIKSEKYKFTYEEVDIISDYISQKIIESVGSMGNCVLLEIKHSISTIISIFGVLKSGNTYVPVGYDAPKEKKEYIQKESNCSFLITDNIENSFELPYIYIKDDILRKILTFREKSIEYTLETPAKYSYILFTSGSTGMPKGVRISLDNLGYILENMQQICPVTSDSVYCFSTPYTFDVSVTEIFGWLYGHGSVVVFDLANFNKFKNLINLIDMYSITHMAASPSILNTIFDMCSTKEYEILGDNIKYFMIAGEKFNRNIAEKWEKHNVKSRLFNLYGPTEATVYGTAYEILRPLKKGDIPIGKPLIGADYKIDYIHGENYGELILIGNGVTDGYLNRDDLTKYSFGVDANGKRYYKTGDLVTLNNNSEIMFIGRKDQQIQIHGIRVELGEIEYYLNLENEISNSAVIYLEQKIYAFICVKNRNTFSMENFKKNIKAKIPSYMCPHNYILLDYLPLTESRKINRRKLIEYIKKNNIIKNIEQDKIKKIESSMSETEIVVKRAFKKALQIPEENILPQTDFFQVGGDSLSLVICLDYLEKIFKIELQVDLIHTYRTVEKIAYNIDNMIFNKYRHGIDNTFDKFTKQDKIEIKDKIEQFLLLKESDIFVESFKSNYMQRSYYYKKYKSTLSFMMNFDSYFTVDEIIDSIQKVIYSNPQLSSILFVDNYNMNFKVYNIDLKNHIMPIIETSNNYNPSEFKAIFDDSVSQLIFHSRYNRGLLCAFGVLKQKRGITICCALDHCISDAASINIIRNDFGRVFSDNVIEKKGDTYKMYCNAIAEKNKVDKILSHWYTKELEKFSLGDIKKLLDIFPNNTQHICISNFYSFDSELVSIFASYFVSKILCDKLNIDYVPINMIANIRKIGNVNLTDTVGDVHTRVTLIYLKSENYNDFKRKSILLIKDVFKKDLFCPRYAAFYKYPEVDDTQLKIKKVFEDNMLISMSFLGAVSDEELEEYNRDIHKLHDNLLNLSNSQLFVTGVINRNVLHLYISKCIFDNNKFNYKDISR